MGDKSFSIAIIDDNPVYLFTMKTFLTRNGFEVDTAEDGKSGFAMIQEKRPDLIMLDVMMETTFSGFEVCRQVRNDPTLKQIPIFGITGMQEELDLTFDKYEDAEYFSPDLFFDKPVDKDTLLARIKDTLV